MNLKCVKFILIIFFLFCSASLTFADPTAGLYKITIKNGWNFISLPMQTLQLSEGLITTKATHTITDTAKSWTVNYYQNYIVMIASGSGEGYFYKISSNTSDTLTLSESISSSISAGNYFYIYQALTLTELFGDYTGPLYADSNKNNADEIYLWDTTTQAFGTPIWLCNTSGQEGWWQGSTKITDNSVTLWPNQACFIVHKPSSDATINYIGIVPNTKQTLNIKSGDNVLGESYPTAVAMSSSGLSSTITSSTSSYTADNLYKWEYANQRFSLPVWHSNYTGYENWYQGSTNFNSSTLDPAEGIMIKNRSTEKNWQRSKPYTAP